jgi:hypothetical protein
MRALFAISIICSFALLTAVSMLVRQLRRAQYLLEKQRSLGQRSPAPTGTPVPGDELEYNITGKLVSVPHPQRPFSQQALRNLAPAKAPDWRFMVNTGGGTMPNPAPPVSDPGKPKGSQPIEIGNHERSTGPISTKTLVTSAICMSRSATPAPPRHHLAPTPGAPSR